MKNRSKNTLQFRTGLVLIIFSSVIYGLLLVVPFINVSTSVKLTIVPVIIIIGEIAFWAGAFFLGKELVRKYRSYFNPLTWFKKRGINKSDLSVPHQIRRLESTDYDSLIEILQIGIDTGNATFEIGVPLWSDWDIHHLDHSRFVAEIDGSVAGWVALSPVSKREACNGVAEVSIYVHSKHWGKGIGSSLMKRVIESSEENGIWTLFSVVFPENKSSLALHKRYGFRVIGMRERISTIKDVWRDTIMLERRSARVGM